MPMKRFNGFEVNMSDKPSLTCMLNITLNAMKCTSTPLHLRLTLHVWCLYSR